MKLHDQLRENVGIAFDALRSSKLRSALTILGVVIGVSTVMSMAAIVRGIQHQIVRTIEIAGPTTFYVMKVYSQTPLNPDALPKWVRVRPDLTRREAERIAQLPEIAYGAIWAQFIGRLEYQGQRTQPGQIVGADDRCTEIQGGDLAAGRWFTRAELSSGSPVAVVNENSVRRLFGRENPVGKTIRLGGRPVEVIGLYVPPENIFAPPGTATIAIVPYLLVEHQFTIDKTNGLYIAVKPRPGIAVEQAQEAVTVLLREVHHLRPSEKNTFDLIVNTVSAPLELKKYLGLLARNGTMVNVGAPPEPLPIEVFTLFANRRSFAGSGIGGIRETQEMLDFCAENGIAPEIELISADKINEAYERVLNSDVRYRFVIDAATFA